MEFFDRKQEVVDIKLTQYGKNLLSRGVDKIEDFKKIQGMSEGLNRALEIIDETTQKYKEGDIDD